MRERCATGSDVTGSDVSHVSGNDVITGSDVSHVSGSDVIIGSDVKTGSDVITGSGVIFPALFSYPYTPEQES